ncbi:MAG: protein-L-isoaspartate(D-aspartate) O-methyltransferase [Candidatus Omnitrophica bacterium]|nr:protein-L-isoaspartate(D-aspartate) O-methyltransferase [Candidatus Omnitrophota bacterium]
MDLDKMKNNMVYKQIFKRGIDDQRILDAFTDVNRHLFVPKGDWEVAYEDYPITIGDGQTISQPFMVAFMIKTLEVEPGMKILEIGTGSGYQSAILATLGADVYTVEIVHSLAKKALETLNSLGYRVHSKVGDGGLGWLQHAPFDRIIVSAGTPQITDYWKQQLKVGGMMVVPVGGFLHQYLVVLSKESEYDFKEKELCQCVFVPLRGEHGHQE